MDGRAGGSRPTHRIRRRGCQRQRRRRPATTELGSGDGDEGTGRSHGKGRRRRTANGGRARRSTAWGGGGLPVTVANGSDGGGGCGSWVRSTARVDAAAGRRAGSRQRHDSRAAAGPIWAPSGRGGGGWREDTWRALIGHGAVARFVRRRADMSGARWRQELGFGLREISGEMHIYIGRGS